MRTKKRMNERRYVKEWKKNNEKKKFKHEIIMNERKKDGNKKDAFQMLNNELRNKNITLEWKPRGLKFDGISILHMPTNAT